MLDYAIVNIRAITSAMKKRYAKQAALPLENDLDAIFKMESKWWSATWPATATRSSTTAATAASPSPAPESEVRWRFQASGRAPFAANRDPQLVDVDCTATPIGSVATAWEFQNGPNTYVDTLAT